MYMKASSPKELKATCHTRHVNHRTLLDRILFRSISSFELIFYKGIDLFCEHGLSENERFSGQKTLTTQFYYLVLNSGITDTIVKYFNMAKNEKTKRENICLKMA